MSLISGRVKRYLALMLVLGLTVSTAMVGLAPRASAAETTYSAELYALVAAECYSNDTTAAGILTSGALRNNETVSIHYPSAEDRLITLKDGVLTAKSYASGYKNLNWIPVKCVINGMELSFNGGTTVSVQDEGTVYAEVEYCLTLSSIGSDILHLPANLMAEAKTQKNMLNKLSEDTYMGYMEQLDAKLLSDVRTFLPLLSITDQKLNSDPAKNTALINCFTEVMGKMLSNCYDDSGTLILYTLLTAYKDPDNGGLAYYYRNAEAFVGQVDLFSGYLTELLCEDPAAGLTAEDKMEALKVLMSFAAAQKPGIAAYADRISELESKMATVRGALTKPNEAINVSSSNLEVLTAILETGKPVSKFDGLPALSTVISTELCNHVYSSDENEGCSFCGAVCEDDSEDKGVPGGSVGTGGSGTGGSGSTGTGSTVSVSTADDFEKSIASAKDGDVIQIARAISMTKNISVNCAVKIVGAERLNDTGYVFSLSGTAAGISTDAALNVASAVDGYVPVKAADSYTYTLAEIAAPETAGSVVGNKAERLEETRYLFLDLDPTNGMALNALRASLSFSEFAGLDTEILIEGNDGTGLVKTADRLVVNAYNTDGNQIARISYVVIVAGDTNCNGKVNTSDATVMKNISIGKEYSKEVLLAADANLSGTLASPKVNSSDAAYIMNKWFSWIAGTYTSNLK